MKERILLGAAIILAAGAFAAATPADVGALSGNIVGNDMTTPLAGAVIRVVNVADGREFVSLPSGANGLFELAGIAEGRYAVTIISGGSSFTLKDRLYVKGRETGNLRLSIGHDTDLSGAAAEPIIGEQIGRLTLGCFGPPKPPCLPPSQHKRHRHHHGNC